MDSSSKKREVAINFSYFIAFIFLLFIVTSLTTDHKKVTSVTSSDLQLATSVINEEEELPQAVVMLVERDIVGTAFSEEDWKNYNDGSKLLMESNMINKSNELPEETSNQVESTIPIEKTTQIETTMIEETTETVVIPEETTVEIVEEPVEEYEPETELEEIYSWNGSVLTRRDGVNYGPTGKETYYNLPMGRVVQTMHNLGFEGDYWIREDGVKMFGDYIMVAANLYTFPRGTIVETSLGLAIVADTGDFAESNPKQLDIAVDW